jgi:hypothetical protein
MTKLGRSKNLFSEGLTLLKVRYKSTWGSCLRPRTPRRVIPGPRLSKGDLHRYDSLLAGHELSEI